MRNFTFLLALLCTLFAGRTAAQTDPGTANLTHQWTFDNGTANDGVGSLNGVLTGGATVVNKALKLAASGQYLSFSGSSLALNAYSVITQEIWFTSQSGANTGYTMLAYFGNSSSGMGYNYVSMSAARGDNVSRTCISSGTYDAEKGVNGTEYDDGKLHQMVSIIRADSVIMYLDGTLAGKAANTVSLSTIGTSLAYLGKGGYTSDPTWLGTISKYSIYNRTLSASEVKFLYQKGAEESEYISSGTTALNFDEAYKTETIKITGINLSAPITISAPEGITVSPTSLDATASGASVTVTYDGTSSVSGTITFASGNGLLNVPVKSYSNSCYTKLYPELTNLVADPYLNTLPSSWGTVSLASGADAYCGSHCVKIAGTATCWPNGGSISTGTITWVPYGTYRFHAKVKTMDGSFNMGVQNANVGGASGDYNILIPTTNGVWTDFDAQFTAGPSPSSGVAFFNNCGSASGTTAFIDNWELYLVPGIGTSASSLVFDEYATTSAFTVTGIRLTEPITVTAPAGITLGKTTFAADATGETLAVIYDGSSSVNGSITLSSGTYTKTVAVKSMSNAGCYSPAVTTAANLISDPYLNELTNFSGSGTRSINTDPAYSYCGVRSGKVTDSGSIIKDLTGVLKPNTNYRVKAKVFKCNPGNVTYTLAIDPAAYPTQYALIKTAMDSACALFNQYTPFSSNIYVYYSSGIPTAQASNYGSIGFGASTGYMWVGTTIHEMDHYFGSGTNSAWQAHVVNGKWNGSVANKLLQDISGDATATLSSDGTHFWPNGINYRTEIENLGGHDAQLKGLINAVKIAKAMIVDDAGLGTNKNPVGIGVYGWSGSLADIYNEVTTTNKWQDVDFSFTTGATLGSTQGVYFSSGTGYIDNWEVYEVAATGVNDASWQRAKLYAVDRKLTAEFELTQGSQVLMSTYDMQGKLLCGSSYACVSGMNKISSLRALPAGLYIVKIKSEEFTQSYKVEVR